MLDSLQRRPPSLHASSGSKPSRLNLDMTHPSVHGVYVHPSTTNQQIVCNAHAMRMRRNRKRNARQPDQCICIPLLQSPSPGPELEPCPPSPTDGLGLRLERDSGLFSKRMTASQRLTRTLFAGASRRTSALQFTNYLLTRSLGGRSFLSPSFPMIVLSWREGDGEGVSCHLEFKGTGSPRTGLPGGRETRVA